MITKKMQQQVWDKSNGICWYCGKQTKWATSARFIGPDIFTVEHVIPQFHGGTDDLENLVPACKTCNSMKRTGSLQRLRYIINKPAVRFTEEQIAYLHECGFSLPNYDTYVFWFEREGRKP